MSEHLKKKPWNFNLYVDNCFSVPLHVKFDLNEHQCERDNVLKEATKI